MSLPEAQAGRPGAQISVIIPAFNAAAHLAQCLDSVIAQHGMRLDVIVVDDGSSDGTRSLINRYRRRVRYLRTARRVGPSAARNLGAQAARHDLLAFFDADDMMAPGRLARQSRLLLNAPAVSCAITDYRNFSSLGEAPASHFDTCTRMRAYIATQ